AKLISTVAEARTRPAVSEIARLERRVELGNPVRQSGRELELSMLAGPTTPEERSSNRSPGDDEDAHGDRDRDHGRPRAAAEISASRKLEDISDSSQLKRHIGHCVPPSNACRSAASPRETLIRAAVAEQPSSFATWPDPFPWSTRSSRARR